MARTSSESETTALNAQPDAPKRVAAEGEFKIADVFDNGSVAVAMEDGRHFNATFEGEDKPKRGAKVSVQSDGVDKDGVPVAATVKAI